MRLFAVKLALVFLPVCAMVAANIVYDPSHIVREGPERQIASLLAAGKRAGGVINFDERKVVKYRIDLLAAPIDVVVIGSSRAMQLRAHAFSGRSFANSSVSAAVLEDLIAICGEYAARNLIPKDVVLGLDPWLLDPHVRHDSWRVMESSYNGMMIASGLPPAPPRELPLDRVALVLSPAYFQQVLRELKQRGSLSIPQPYEATSEDDGVLLPDGSRVYPRATRERTAQQVLELAVATASRMHLDAASVERELDAFAERRLEALVRYLQSRGARVAFLLSPYHPTTLALLRQSNDAAMMSAAERYYRKLAASFHVPLFGSYDPAAAGCSGEEFFDGEHPRESCVEKQLRRTSAMRGG